MLVSAYPNKNENEIELRKEVTLDTIKIEFRKEVTLDTIKRKLYNMVH